MKEYDGLQTTQPTSGGAVTADTNCCANCVDTSLPQSNEGPIYRFLGKPVTRNRWMAGAASYKSTGQVGLGVGSWPSNRATEISNPKGTLLYFVILFKNVKNNL